MGQLTEHAAKHRPEEKKYLHYTRLQENVFLLIRQQQITSTNQRSAKNVGELKNNMEELSSTSIKTSSRTKHFRDRAPTQSSNIHRSMGCTFNAR